MRTILFKLNQFPNLSETFILAQIILAIDSGFKVKIVVSQLLDIEGSRLEELIYKYSICNLIVIEDFRIPKSRVLRLISAVYLFFLNLKYLKKLILYYKEQEIINLSSVHQFHFYRKFKEYDIVHVQYGTNTWPMDVLKKIGLLGSKLIVSFHGHDAFFPINGHIPNNGYYDKLFNYGDLVIANTAYLANELLKLGCPHHKIQIIPVGVDTSFFVKGETTKTPQAIFNLISVGRLEKVKGHEYAIQVAELLSKKGCKISLIIIGEGSERGKLEKIILSKNLEGVVKLVGKKSPLEVRDMLRSSDVFIFTSVATKFNRRETQGLATIEAQACGLPVVVFDSGGVKYTLMDNVTGYIVPEYDVNLMSERVEQLFNNPKLTKKMGIAAISFVEEQFSQNQIKAKWAKAYEINS